MHNRHAAYLSPLLFIVVFVTFLSSSFAQTPPITSSGLNTQVSAPVPLPSGQTMTNITGGTRPGNGPNLYHSFGNFNVPANNIANFLNETALPTSNILGRVTGGNVSNIFGTIQTTGFGNANLFLMNPAGFLFGPAATVNVGGMVAFTSADYLRLADGNKFNAKPSMAADALISTAPVAAFGFLGSNPGAITVQGSQFTVTNNTGISLVGGDITLTGAQLSAPAGQVNLVSVKKPQQPNKGGEISALDFSPSPVSGFKTMGTITIASGTIIDTSTEGVTVGQRGGTISIRSGELVVSKSSLLADGHWPTFTTSAEGPAGSIEVHVKKVTLDQATLSSSSDKGNGGQIRFMDLESLNSTETNLVATAGASQGANGLGIARGSITMGSDTTKSITLNATTLSTIIPIANDGSATSGVDQPGITLTAKKIDVNGGTFDASAGVTDVDPGGSITFNGDTIALTNAFLRSRDTSGGGGGGTVTFQGLMSTESMPTRAKSVTMDGANISLSALGTRPGGTITVHADQATLENSSLTTQGIDRGGIIDFADVGTLKTANSNLTAFGADTSGGTIVLGSLGTKSIKLADTTLSVLSGQQGGTIEITAPNLFESVRSTSYASSSGGSGGTIAIHAGQLRVLDGSTLNALGAGAGQEGTILFEYGKSLTVKDSIVTPAATIVPGWNGN